jgi:hypothetical protein
MKTALELPIGRRRAGEPRMFQRSLQIKRELWDGSGDSLDWALINT